MVARLGVRPRPVLLPSIYPACMLPGCPRFLCPQVWLSPDSRGHTPQYGSAQYKPENRRNGLLHILGGTGAVPAWPGVQEGQCIKLHQLSRSLLCDCMRHVTAAPGRHRETRQPPTRNACSGMRLMPTPAMAILAPATLPSPAPHPAFRPTPSLQDANVFVSESDAGVTHDIVLPAGRQAYLLCIEGSLAVGTSDAGKHGLQAALLVPLLLLLTFLCSTAACTACCEARACRASAQHRKYHLMLQRSASPLPPLLQRPS